MYKENVLRPNLSSCKMKKWLMNEDWRQIDQQQKEVFLLREKILFDKKVGRKTGEIWGLGKYILIDLNVL